MSKNKVYIHMFKDNSLNKGIQGTCTFTNVMQRKCVAEI